MARRKQAAAATKRRGQTPDPQSKRQLEESPTSLNRNNGAKSPNVFANGFDKSATIPSAPATEAGLTQLIICVAGIYASFLSWALLQERITTTTYGPDTASTRFTYPVFLNTLQSLFAALTSYLYMFFTTPSSQPRPRIFPTKRILPPLLLIAITSSLASPFGYASLAHLDYITFILAKSCKLLPVMALHLTIFRKRYPLYKYAVVALVTAGVAIFTLHHPSSSKKSNSTRTSDPNSSTWWGLSLLGINLLFDGLTNSTQDYIFGAFQPYTGPQMMCAQNVMSTALTSAYLLLSPYLAQTPLGAYIGVPLNSANGGPAGEFGQALAFVRTYPMVGRDVLGFALCGAVGQLFIFYTLSTFSSLLLVTVTVTRKMLTMMLSVLAFGHRLSHMQWVGVGLVFGGVGAEGWIQRVEKKKKAALKKKQ